MKKIAIYSFFNSYNIGDILIAEQIKKLFSSHQNSDFFDISTGKPHYECELKQYSSNVKNNFKSFLFKMPLLKYVLMKLVLLKSRQYKKLVSAANDCEVAIFAGGNIIMELNKYPSTILTLFRTVKYLKNNNKKICFCFCGVGPFNCYKSRKIAQKIIELADFISVRDRYSYDLVNQLTHNKKIEIWADPVLLLSPEISLQKNGKAIGINAYFGHDVKKKNGMCSSYVMCIKQLRKKYINLPIYLFSTECSDINDLNIVKNYFLNDELVKVINISSSEELFDFYNNINVVLGTRMHTVITATISKLPVVSISWQKKVESVMELLQKSDLNYDADFFISYPISVVEAIEKCFHSPSIYIEKTNKRLFEIRTDTIDSFKNFISVLED